MPVNEVALTSGMRANLYSLQKTAKALDLTQNRLSTGKRVMTALDDPVNFFAAAGHEQRAADLAYRKDEMGEALQTIKSAQNGIDALLNLIESAKSLASSAKSATSTTEAATYQAQYNTIRAQIDYTKADSLYKGINLLESENLVVNFDETGVSTLTLSGFDASTGTGGLNISSAASWHHAGTGSDIYATTIDADIVKLDAAKTNLRAESKELATNLSIITAREDFTQKMINTLTDGAGKLTDADMNEEGANMLMLQTRQSLGTTSLSIASQAAQAVLRLF